MHRQKVLSIQSHVVSGYVGNKTACFPLQVLGFDVDIINSVQFSNHTGYDAIKGQVLNGDDLDDIISGLKQNNLHQYSYLLTGYMGSSSFIAAMVDVVKELRKMNPDLFFLCDPVMGDNNKMYVPEDILPIYRDQLLPMASLLTPNQFEAELLTGIPIKTAEDVNRAMAALHAKGVEIIVISSAKLKHSNDLTLFASMVRNGTKSSVKMNIPELDAQFTGSGDLFAALLLAWMSQTNFDLMTSCENAVNTVQSVLCRTLQYAKDHVGPDGKLTPELMELRLIQSKKDIEMPPNILSATDF